MGSECSEWQRLLRFRRFGGSMGQILRGKELREEGKTVVPGKMTVPAAKQ